MQINKRKALKFSKVMLVEIKKMPNPVPSQMA
jgi:hypothetical protein